MRRLAATAIAALLTAGPAVALQIESIEAKVFLSYSAALSQNVAEGSGVNLWNTVIGEGEINEPAQDVLIIVTVSADPGSFDAGTLQISVTGSEGEMVASRTLEGLLIGPEGKVATAVYVEHATCTALTVKASVGKSEKTVGVPFACGE